MVRTRGSHVGSHGGADKGSGSNEGSGSSVRTRTVVRTRTLVRTSVRTNVRTPVRTLVPVLGILMAVAGCSSRGATAIQAAPAAAVPSAAEISAADESVRVGCYTCLRDAVETYARVTAARPAPDIAQRLFETSLLLTLRSKEIGLPPEHWLERARASSPHLPAGIATASILDLVEMAPLEPSGLAARTPGTTRFSTEVLHALPAWRQRIGAAGLYPTTQRYLELTIVCADREARDAIIAESHATAVPLLRYRRATCGPAPDADVGRLLDENPRWSEAGWFEGRRLLATSGDLTAAVEVLSRASRAFPESGAMLMSLGGAQRAAGQLTEALASYDAVLAQVPDHRDALLGRVLCLTYLERHDEAVAAATRLVDLGMYLMADAYYWRAWNHYQLKALDLAWADVALALPLQTGTNLHTLAGLIAYARTDLQTSLGHFERARTLDADNCDAWSYTGIVQGDLNAWHAAAPAFVSATGCFAAAAAASRADFARLQASTQSAAYKQRQGAELQKATLDHERKAATAAYNAAQGLARTGQTSAALAQLAIAAAHESTREQAEALKKQLTRQRE